MIKDFLKILTCILEDKEIKPSEKVLLERLILYYNCEKGYAYPKYEHLMDSLSTNRRETISKNLKSLAEKGYITIGKANKGNKNIYYIHKHLHFVENRKSESKNRTKGIKDKNVDYTVTYNENTRGSESPKVIVNVNC